MSTTKLEILKAVAYEIDSIPFPVHGWVYRYEGRDSEFRWHTSHKNDEEPNSTDYFVSAADAEYYMDSYVDGIDSENIREFSL